jgi:TP901 family phage tail tape measure protein
MKLGTAYVVIKADMKKLPGQLRKAEGKVKKSIGRMQKAVNTLSFGHLGLSATAFTAAIGLLGREVISVGRDFERTTKTVQAWSGATGKSLDSLTKIARKMGAETEWSATQAASSLKFLAAAGFTASQSVEALPRTLDLATAGQVDLATTSDITTDVLTAFGLKVNELSRVNDAFINTTTSSNTNVLMLGESMRMVAPTAKTLGFTIEQTSALLGTLANSGVKATMAGTGLNAVMLKSSKAAKMLGMDAMAPLVDVLKEMKKEQWDATKIAQAFGIRHVKTAAILMNNVTVYEKLLGKIKENSGATQRLANIIRDGLDNDLKILASTIQDQMLTAYDNYYDSLRDVIQSTTDWINENDDLIQQNMSAVIDGITASVKNLYTIYSSMPDDIVGAAGYGIVGIMLFGKTGAGPYLTAMLILNQLMAKMSRQEGPGSFWDAADISIQRVVKDLKEAYQASAGIMAGFHDLFFGSHQAAMDTAKEWGFINDEITKNISIIDASSAAYSEWSKQNLAAKNAVNNMMKSVKKFGDEKSKEKKTLDANTRSIIKSYEEYQNWSRQNREAIETLKTHDRSLRTSSDGLDQYTRNLRWNIEALKEYDRQLEQTANIDSALEDFFGELDTLEKKMSEVPNNTSMMWNQAMRNIQDIWGNAFEGMLTGSIRSFDDFTHSILDAFKRMLAQMAAQWLASGLMGLLTGKGFGGFSIGGGSGGGGALSTLSTIASVAKHAKSAYELLAGAGKVTSGGALSSLGNAALYGKAALSAWGSGVGTASSWFAGMQAANMGVNAGTQLALIEGTYGASTGGTAAAAGGTGAAGAGGGIAAGGALAAIATVFADIAQMIFTGKPGILGSMLSSNNPPYIGGINYAQAWASGRPTTFDAAGNVVPIEDLKGISESWKVALSEMERIFDVDLDTVLQTNWRDLEEKLSWQMGTGAEQISAGMMEAVQDYVRAAKAAEQGWATMTEDQREKTNEMFAELYLDLTNQMADVFSAGAEQLGGAVSSAIASTSVAVNVRVLGGSSGPKTPREIFEGGGRTSGLEGGGAALGGVYSGPDTGYLALLHGTERVVPVESKPAPLPAQKQTIVIPIHVAGQKVDEVVLDLVDGHIVRRNRRGIPGTMRAI